MLVEIDLRTDALKMKCLSCRAVTEAMAATTVTAVISLAASFSASLEASLEAFAAMASTKQ